MTKKISVVLTTYKSNQVFLEKQLESIKKQTLKSSEVIIIDDFSCDNTVRFIESYISSNNLKSWLLFPLDKNVGYKNAFKKGIEIAYTHNPDGFIFMADHDDIWMLDKIEKMMKVMNKNPEVILLGGNSIPIDSDDKIISNSFITGVEDLEIIDAKEKLYRFSFDNLLKGGRFQGCVSCFKSELVPLFLEHFTESLPHDYQLDVAACNKKGLFYLNDCVVHYRLHENQQIGVGKGPDISTYKGKLFQVNEMLEFYTRVADLVESYRVHNKVLMDMTEIFEARKNILLNWSLVSSFCWVFINIKKLKYYGYLGVLVRDVFAKKSNSSRG